MRAANRIAKKHLNASRTRIAELSNRAKPPILVRPDGNFSELRALARGDTALILVQPLPEQPAGVFLGSLEGVCPRN